MAYPTEYHGGGSHGLERALRMAAFRFIDVWVISSTDKWRFLYDNEDHELVWVCALTEREPGIHYLAAFLWDGVGFDIAVVHLT